MGENYGKWEEEDDDRMSRGCRLEIGKKKKKHCIEEAGIRNYIDGGKRLGKYGVLFKASRMGIIISFPGRNDRSSEK